MRGQRPPLLRTQDARYDYAVTLQSLAANSPQRLRGWLGAGLCQVHRCFKQVQGWDRAGPGGIAGVMLSSELDESSEGIFKTLNRERGPPSFDTSMIMSNSSL